MKTLPLACFATLFAIASSSVVAGPRIGVLLRDRDIFYGAVEKGAAEAAERLDAELVVKSPQSANQLAQQLAMMAALEKEEIVALIASPLKFDEFHEPLARMAARGVKIVILETPVPDGVAQAWLGYNQEEMAQTAARLFVEQLSDGDEVAMLRANSLERISLREKTFLATVRELRPAITLHADVMAGSRPGDDFEMLGILLEKHPGIKGLCTPFSASSNAAVKLIQERGLGGKIVHLGFGTGLPAPAAEALTTGTMQVWIAQQPKLFGSKGVEAALALINGESVPAVIDVPYIVVTKANLDSPEVAELRSL